MDPKDRLYHPDHMWARAEDDGYRIGVTDYATAQLGEVVYLELPEVGSRVKAGKALGSIESVKVTSDLISPLDGIVAELNHPALADPSLVESSPLEAGWLLRVREVPEGQVDALLDAAAYAGMTGKG